MSATCLVVMGVSGAGKTTIARRLADELGWPLAEADEFHPPDNIRKMSAGVPLTDDDRIPWLEALRDWITERAETGESTIVSCSALKRAYRDLLRGARARVRFVHLAGDAPLIMERLSVRSDHFMPPSLLDSQFADLEPLAGDEDGVVVDLGQEPDRIVESALTGLALRAPER
ncbi:gluconate kinase [Saccharomonospora azurea SZMC 14600]|uniref:gluconokinase n=1 Tax=Saccharomonospora azurea TaxID=40988 RepID=UPI00023FEB14|nr:gluconokinase [Saccharomonospora azurea]EHK81846.1 gluconate kinase [Saccharomonospora azurea SZMC 14600]